MYRNNFFNLDSDNNMYRDKKDDDDEDDKAT